MTAATTVTADQLWTMPPGRGERYELVAGELRVMSPSGWRHGKVTGRLHTRLGPYVEKHGLGVVFGAETGFRLSSDPDTVRAPDVSYVSAQKLSVQAPEEGFWPGAPDLAVEVLSPSDRTGEVDEKIGDWLQAGCIAVWVVDPKLETVTVYRSRTDVEVKTVGDTLEGAPVIPGFSCLLNELFG